MGDLSLVLGFVVAPIVCVLAAAGVCYTLWQLCTRRSWWIALAGSVGLVVAVFAGLVTYVAFAPCDAPGIECHFPEGPTAPQATNSAGRA